MFYLKSIPFLYQTSHETYKKLVPFRKERKEYGLKNNNKQINKQKRHRYSVSLCFFSYIFLWPSFCLIFWIWMIICYCSCFFFHFSMRWKPVLFSTWIEMLAKFIQSLYDLIAHFFLGMYVNINLYICIEIAEFIDLF